MMASRTCRALALGRTLTPSHIRWSAAQTFGASPHRRTSESTTWPRRQYSVNPLPPLKVDLSRGTWLLPFSAQIGRLYIPRADFKGDFFLDEWVDERLRQINFFGPLPLTQIYSSEVFPDDSRTSSEWAFLNSLAHSHILLLELLERCRGSAPTIHARDHLAVLGVAALAHKEDDAAKHLLWLADRRHNEERMAALLDSDPDALVRTEIVESLAPYVKAIGQSLLRSQLQDNAEPLLHSPYHRIVQYLDIKLMARIGAATLFEGDRIDTNKIGSLLDQHHAAMVASLEALIDMVFADGKVKDMEVSTLANVIHVSRLSDADKEGLNERVIKYGVDVQPGSDQLEAGRELGKTAAQRLYALDPEDVPTVAKLLYVQCLIHMLLHDDLNPSNEAFLGSFAHTSHLTADDCTRLEAQAEAYMATHPELVDAYSWGSTAKRLQDRVTVKCIDTCLRYRDFLSAEIAETKELIELLNRPSVTPEEQAKIRSQVTDIAKMVPALALFCCPGGSVLLPAVMQILDLRPSAVREHQDGTAKTT